MHPQVRQVLGIAASHLQYGMARLPVAMMAIMPVATITQNELLYLDFLPPPASCGISAGNQECVATNKY